MHTSVAAFVRSVLLAATLLLPGCACHEMPPQAAGDPPWSRTVVLLAMPDLVPSGQETAELDARIEGRLVWHGVVSKGAPHPSVIRIDLAEPLPSSGTLHVEVQVGSSRYTADTPACDDGFLEVNGRLDGIRLSRTDDITSYE